MTDLVSDARPEGFGGRLATLVKNGAVQLLRPASHSRRAEARTAVARRSLLLGAGVAVLVVALMLWLDAAEIGWMPARGTAWLWPLRIVTDFGKSHHVFAVVGAALALVTLLAALRPGYSHAVLSAWATRLQFVLVAVAFPVGCAEILKGLFGRGRPFVGGPADAFNFQPWTWEGAYNSFPSGHSVTACALAVAVAAVWPRLRGAMIVYAVVILLTRLVLLAHHPSDVVAGALVGIVGALAVRYWYAARRIAFVIARDGAIVARPPPAPAALVHAARGALGA